MALRPAGRRSIKPVRHGVPVLNKAKVRALRAFFSWMDALAANPGAQLSDFARGANLRERTIWHIVRSDPALAEKYLAQIGGTAAQGLMMAFQRGIQALTATGTFHDTEEGRVVQENDVGLLGEQRRWGELFAKYVHGGFTAEAQQKGGVTINIGLPAHVRANLGLTDEQTMKKIDATIKDGVGEIIDV